MAIKITTEHKANRQDTFRLHPDDVAEGRNSRMIKAVGYDKTVIERALSIAKHGQLQPVLTRRDKKTGTLTMVMGYTRRDAIKLLRQGFFAIDPDTGVDTYFHQPEADLWVKVEDMTEDEAFLKSIAENVERKDTTDLQEALAQSELRTTMGWTDSKIARFYGYTNQNRVAALSKLLALPEKVQQQVHSGDLALYAALDTLTLTEEERDQVIDGAVGENGKVQGATLRKLIRDLYEKKEEVKPEATGETESAEEEAETEADTPKKKVLKRNVKDLERFVTERAEAGKLGGGLGRISRRAVSVVRGQADRRLPAERVERVHRLTLTEDFHVSSVVLAGVQVVEGQWGYGDG